MPQRYVAIWFCALKTDWFIIRQPLLRHAAFVVSEASHGRMLVAAASGAAQADGISTGMLVADARAVSKGLQVFDNIADLAEKLLNRLAIWCIRFTPCVAVDLPDGLLLDVTGCSHLWGGDGLYLEMIQQRLTARGYQVKLGMADTIGAAWAIARYSKRSVMAESGMHTAALLSLPVASLRIDTETVDRLNKLGLRQISQCISMPRSVLKRRFGESFLERLHQALGTETETIEPVMPPEPYQERLPCPEPIVTATGIEMALQQLTDRLCHRLEKQGKGLRTIKFNCYRVDGKTASIETGTTRATHHSKHLYTLLEEKIATIEPGLGIELFVLEGARIEDVVSAQVTLWKRDSGLADIKIAELLDRIENKMGTGHIHRYLPDEHYWPERSYKLASSLDEATTSQWKTSNQRPLHVLTKPAPIEVTAPAPITRPCYSGTTTHCIK